MDRRSGCERRHRATVPQPSLYAAARSGRLFARWPLPGQNRRPGRGGCDSCRTMRSAADQVTATPVWLVLPDPFSSRLFFDTGIVYGLRCRVDHLELLLLDTGEHAAAGRERAGDVPVTTPHELAARRPPLTRKVFRRADRGLDRPR